VTNGRVRLGAVLSPWLLAVVALGLTVSVWLRLAPLFADFAFGDGGLFWVMARDLRANGFVPPDFTTYNSGDIPWVYPPLGLYVVALLGADLDLFRILPALYAIATLPAVWLLARELIGERGALIAVVAYGLSAPAYAGLIAGGGVTRAPGLTFAVLTMWAVVRGNVVAAGVLGGLTLLTHPIAAFYAVLSCAVLWLIRDRSPRMTLAPLISLAMGALWVIPMALRHGFGPFVAGMGSRELDLSDSFLTLMAQTMNPPNLAFTIGVVGAVIALYERRWDLILWLAVTALGVAVVDRWLAIPMAILAALAMDAAISVPARLRSVALFAVAGVAGITGILLSTKNETLSSDQLSVMEWAHTKTEAGAEFALIGYPVDRGFVEWFPALAGRENVTTWQGSEWIGASGDQRMRSSTTASCRIPACLPAADYYIFEPACCRHVIAEMRYVRDGVYTLPPHLGVAPFAAGGAPGVPPVGAFAI
jgi:hypothetical protein